MFRAIMILMTLVLLRTGDVECQPAFPPPGQIYVQESVPRIDIFIHPDTLAWIYANVQSDIEFRSTFVFSNGSIADTLREVGFRLRGNTSRNAPKKSFKISFNSYEEGRKYYGFEKLNLNGEHNDPSVIRSRIVWNIYRQAGLPVPRSNHVKVYINNSFYGLYINVEHIDENFVKSRFGNNDGDLYKCLYPADLAWLGSNPEMYKMTSGDRRVYELNISDKDDYTVLVRLIEVLNNTPIDQLPCELEKVFNVQDYLKVAAIDVLTGNWDNYIYNKNNFFLYQNTSTGQFEYLPYDVDNTFGIDWFGINWATRNIYSWSPSSSGEKRPLFTRLMQVPAYRAHFTYYLKQAISQITGTQKLKDSILTLKSLIEPIIPTDPFYPRTYGFNLTSFVNSYTQATGAHVKWGLLPFIDARNQSALSQTESGNAPPVIKYIQHNKAAYGQRFVVTAYVEDEDVAPGVTLEYRINQSAWNSVVMRDDGTAGDGPAGDRIFGATLEGQAMNDVIELQIKAADSKNSVSLKPCSPVQWKLTNAINLPLFINEFMASNSNTIADEHGEYDDWIEIYNAGDEPVSMNGLFLTDNLGNPSKFALPDISVPAMGFILVWADDQPAQGSRHAPFKLDKEGEQLGIFRKAASGYALVDSYTYGPQSNNISSGRRQDASSEWISFTRPTPGRSNHLLSTTGSVSQPAPLRVWPNPSSAGTVNFNHVTDFELFSITGKLITAAREALQADISFLRPGVYLLKAKDGQVIRIILH